MEKPTFVIDGNRFNDLEGFYDEVEQYLIPDTFWGRNLDAFNDILRGGVGLPRTFILVWKNIDKSRSNLGYEETANFLQEAKRGWLDRYLKGRRYKHPELETVSAEVLTAEYNEISKVELTKIDEEIALAQQGQGETIFDWIMEMILDERKDVEFRPE
jgi:RNAse (barnase) inhibitor barstar